MIAIRVRYCPATNRQGSRLVATDGRHRLSVPYKYGNDDQENLKLAIQFKLKYFPGSLELNPVPFHFDHNDYFGFYPEADREKLEELLSQCPQPQYVATRLSFINQRNNPAILYTIGKARRNPHENSPTD